MMNASIDLLRKMPAFGGLKPTSLELILNQSEAIRKETGETFFCEGERGDRLFVLQTGQVRIQRKWQGNAIKLGTLGPGDCFGEMALIDFQKRSATVMAECSCQAICVPASALALLYRQDVEQYAIIMMNLGREVSRRLRLADNRLFELVHRHGQGDTIGIPEV